MKTCLHLTIGARTSVRFPFPVLSGCGLKSALRPGAGSSTQFAAGRPWRLALLFAFCATFTLLTHTTLAQTWQTVDDFQYVTGQTAVSFGLTVAPSGILFASGYGFDASGLSH